VYQAVADPYCYVGTGILRNRLGLRSQAELDAFEADAVALRADEPLPIGRFSPTHYRAIHRHLFQDVYAWAGRYRTVRMSKGGNMFCFPEHIAGQFATLFAELRTSKFLKGLSADAFADAAAHFLSEINAIHAFREGNGRAQLAFFSILADHAGHPLDLGRLQPGPFLTAMIDSFGSGEKALALEVRRMI
jgi:cell filamentation protein